MNAPPILVSFSTPEKYFDAMGVDPDSTVASKISGLIEKNLPPVVSRTSLGVLFGYSPRFVGAMIRNPERYYRTFTIPKGRKRRKIDAPRVALKVIQKWFGYHLANVVKLPDPAVGFVPKVSAVDGAGRHCLADWVFSTDIVNFFPSTSLEAVTSALVELGYDRHGAEVVAGFACLADGLAQGSPCSPVLSNLVCVKLDRALENYANSQGLRYTRYADDIVFSGKGNPPNGLKKFVLHEVESRGWSVSKKKTMLAHRPRRLKVYGLLVNGDKPRLTKGYRNRIRALKHLHANQKLDAEKLEEALGHLAYAKSVEEWAGVL